MIITGRENEQKILNRSLKSKRSELLAIYGRRRIGKTFLIREYFTNYPLYIEFTGQYKAPIKTQIDNFVQIIEEKWLKKRVAIRPKNWKEVFSLLKDQVTQLPQKKKVVIFIDELPWFNTPRSQFLSHLTYFWNGFAEKHRNILLIVCGSAASWMIENIVNSKGGLHNRLTQAPIQLSPFTLKEVSLFLEKKKIKWEKRTIVDLYMITGGVPYYLEALEKKHSLIQNIDKICFHKNGILLEEYERLFDSLFNNSNIHKKIVESLVKVKKGMLRKELLKKMKVKGHPSGAFQRALKNLEESDFIQVTPGFRKNERDRVYRIKDEYTVFYLNWIKSLRSRIKSGQISNYWSQQSQTQGYKAWSGFAFEGVCLKHFEEIKKALGISGIQVIPGQWHGKESQIDLLLDRADRTISICEMKYFKGEYTVSKEYARKFEEKQNLFRRESGVKESFHRVLVTSHGVQINNKFHDSFDLEITLDQLF